MKHILYLSIIAVLISCGEKTEESSKYSSYISELNESNNLLDSSYSYFSEIDNVTLQKIKNQANDKLDSLKFVYKSDTIDPKFENIILIARGGIFKTLRKYLVDYDNCEKEYKFSKKQYNTLKANLIHETLSEENAKLYTSDEKKIMLQVNNQINELNKIAKETHSLSTKIFSQLDSIYSIHEKK